MSTPENKWIENQEERVARLTASKTTKISLSKMGVWLFKKGIGLY
jgi:hypothetical protein